MRESGGMRAVTPGKCLSKNSGRREVLFSKQVKCDEGRKSVHVKEPSRLGMAMNMNS